MRIGQASEASGASVRALRYYEAEGLITPGRHMNGYRDYCASTIATVLQVRSLLEAGLPVRLIREALPYLGDESDPARLPCEVFLLEVERYRDRLVERIADLTSQESALSAYLRQARSARS
ncbi:MAG TPA: MerR family transcriptional regulator [Nocardioidaceae bacterium]|nr:MerR family transcriptional regulator [Nocardioidaceae bacterium]